MKKKTILSLVFSAVGIALIIGVTATVNSLALGKFDNLLEQYFGKEDNKIIGATHGADVDYIKSDFNSPKALYEYEEKVCSDIAMEGATVLENKGILPLAKNTELSLFSHSSVDLVSGGSGSGSGSFELTADLKEGLEATGLKVNKKLWDFYKSGKGSGYSRGTGVINYGAALDWKINECPLSVITSDTEVTQSFAGTTAMYVLSRTGGEGGDEARDMAAYGGASGNHYLEPDTTELEIIQYLQEHFDNIIILVNCNNAMELGWTKNYSHIKAVVNFPGAGRTGTYGLGRVLTGLDSDGNEISASGHLVDTFVYDNFSSPAVQNMGDFRYKDTNYYYVNYSEGIYVGYKYYETRYEDAIYNETNVGDYDYSNTVLYPFGYGLSYTNFSWSNYKVSNADAKGNIEISLEVKNVGARRGQDVVQVYVHTPYTTYDKTNGIEKSSVSLVGFAKTKVLDQNEVTEVKITANVKDFISYDSKNTKGYILEKADYHITAASDAHAAINNIIKARNPELANKLVKSPSEEVAGNASLVGVYTPDISGDMDTTTYNSYSNDNGSGTITNLFDGCTRDDAKYLSRTNWKELDNNGLRYGEASSTDSGAEVNGKQWVHDLDDATKAKLDSRDSLNPNEGKNTKSYEWGKKNGVELIDLRGKDYNDPLWNELLDEITLPEMTKLIEEDGYCSPEVKSIKKVKVNDLDGPAGLNKVVGHGSADIGDGYLAMTWPSEYMIACTWNVDLATQMGVGVGEDGLYSGVTGWYGPAMNIHRTPFAGRNFEYYSEDPYISGILGKAATQGAASKGVYAFIKHFALNDQETHRDHLGLITWSGEQAIRELYLKPFEICIKDNYQEVNYNDAVKNEKGEITSFEMKNASLSSTFAVMSSFNRIGTTWAGGNYNLITGVLRNEWGYNGFVLTDYEVPSYMVTNQALAAGGDGKLKTVDMSSWFGSSYDLANYPAYQGYAKNAAHHILYTVVNSAAMNGYVHGRTYVNGFAYYKYIIIGLDAVALIGVATISFFVYRKIRKEKLLNK